MSRNALIVGINQYQSQSLQDLKAPALDAEAIAQRLEEDGDFDTLYRLPERITEGEAKKPLVSDTHPVTREQLEQALEQLFLPESSQAPDTALFYFSGHGIPDQKGFDKGYLATSDTNPNQSRSGLSLRWLQWLLSESTVKQQIIWLDCCHSGSLLVKVEAANPGHGESKDRCFIASSRDFEQSWEDLNSPYSVLTKALLDGLDPKRLPGRWIDTFALVDHVNQALKGELQTPVCTNFGDAINLTRSWQVQAEPSSQSQVDSGICPYKGLEFFDCNDEDPKYFFGREQLVGQLLDQVRTSNFLALVGASGNGKSSVLRAGLLHQLKLGRRISGSDQWRIRITRPDRQPMQNLALAFVEEGLSDLDRAAELGKASGLLTEGAAGLQQLIQASSAPRTVLVIDQFEEVFTRCENPEERERFFACLMGALSDTDNKLCLIIAMRADFIVKCMEQKYSGLARLIDQQMVSVLPMESDELRSAICRPAEQVNLNVEPALVTEILNDIEGAPGSLPLLQYTLKELWNQRQDNQLTFGIYQNLGGIQGTLDQRATAIYNSFDEAEQQTVQHIFQQLTQLGEGTEDTRRRVFQDDLVTEPKHPAQRVQQVVERLSSPENRLIVTSEVVSKSDQANRMSIVDVAHEALIRHWKLLRQWIEQNRDLLRKQRRIEASAISWRNQGQKSGYLLQGLPLIEAIQFNKNQAETFSLSDNGRAFIQKGVRQRRLNRLKTSAWLIVPALILLVVVENSLREAGIKQDFARLDGKGGYEEKQAVESLVRGCKRQQEFTWIPNYLTERLFGNCRSLVKAPLVDSSLSSADLSSADLRRADLRRADLTGADLSGANLNSADLSTNGLISMGIIGADLGKADLSIADLSKIRIRQTSLIEANLLRTNLSNSNLKRGNLLRLNLSNSILLGTDFREATNLTQSQLEGRKPPLICNSKFPQNISIDFNRDCDKLAAELHNRYPKEFPSLEEAQKYVKEQRQKKWD
ncbi:pentapeptide repeat-containing protein (plasmid) [Acaryochloris sp. 'Moss Beach']|uniref:nSTAND1 domain-containing NTPase n=1 Tax=Acaryochloris sp. 'Moss Beach' TaxID=2740837 RepID=UPI001F43C3D5|nr:pentapeptide repeat-containing protein [Acaryochloris sp. 'Moss Beach']UJB72983.1 pentapeptide repeat-containing protein [Acaryochloris sp. 'Moss Beach']